MAVLSDVIGARRHLFVFSTPYLAGTYVWYGQQIRLIREMSGVRDYRLVLCADVLDCAVDDSAKTLERIAEEVGGGAPPIRTVDRF